MINAGYLVRQRVHEGKEVSSAVSAVDLADEGLLKPVLDDDALILCLDDLPETTSTAETKGEKGTAETPQVETLLRKNAELQAELEQLTKQFTNYRLAVQKTLDERWQADEEPPDASAKAAVEDKKPKKDDSEYYFESYAHNDIHETMIKDAVRTDAYRDFIYNNKDLFEGKTVLDIGCGTGILSLFCARAGAAKVIAVDRSDILDKARENVFRNELDGVITCVKGCIEDVILPVKQVDIIVSEWMGYALLYEAMLPSILYARDRYLVPGGLVVPSHASMWVAPVSDAEYMDDHVRFWNDVYGFDMQAMKTGQFVDSRVVTMPETSLSGFSSMFRFLDLHTVKTDDLVFEAPYQSTLTTPSPLNGFLIWFDMFFARTRDDVSVTPTTTAKEWASGDRVAFTTGPAGTETHWRQILFLVDEEKNKTVVTEADVGKEVAGVVKYSTAEGHARGLNIKISWGIEEGQKQEQDWLLH